VAALSAAAFLTSCAPRARSGTAAGGAGSAYIGLNVKNDNWLDVHVYVVRGGSRFRLGDVSGNTTRSLRISEGLIVAGAIQLMVDPVGLDDPYVTDVMLVAPDQRVQLMVAPRMRLSTYAVWSR
jgi:hypothetical protein